MRDEGYDGAHTILLQTLDLVDTDYARAAVAHDYVDRVEGNSRVSVAQEWVYTLDARVCLDGIRDLAVLAHGLEY